MFGFVGVERERERGKWDNFQVVIIMRFSDISDIHYNLH